MINVNDFKTGMTVSYEGNLYQVLEFQHVKPGKGAAIVKAKLKNLSLVTTQKDYVKLTQTQQKDINVLYVEAVWK